MIVVAAVVAAECVVQESVLKVSIKENFMYEKL
jgi:hypothetical protein